MKGILFAALLCFAFTARADVIVPTPTRLIVSNLGEFPKYKFTIATGEGDTAKTEALADGKSYTLHGAAKLLVQDDQARPTVWATVEDQAPRGRNVAIIIKRVQRTDKGIEVQYDKDVSGGPRPHPPYHVPTPPKAPAATTTAWPHFVLAGLGCCGLVLLRTRTRRNRPS